MALRCRDYISKDGRRTTKGIRQMNPSERIATLNQYIRINAPTDAEICELLDIVTDEFKADEIRQNKQLERMRRNFKNIAKYIQNQAN